MPTAAPTPSAKTILACPLDTITPLPPGYLAAMVTYLEQDRPPAPRADPPPAGFALKHVPQPDTDWYRALFRHVGTPSLWYTRLAMSDAVLRERLMNPGTEIHVLTQDGAEIGLVELSRWTPDIVAILYFGVVPGAVGTGAGRFMMNRILERAWSHAPTKVILNTCTLDHPAALPFYLRSGFRAVSLGVELQHDPRHLGLLPRTAAPHIPFVPLPQPQPQPE